MGNKLSGNGFEYTFQEDGSWLYKAIPLNPLKVKPVEKPQIKAVVEIERNYLGAFEKRMRDLSTDITKYLS